VLFPGVIQQGRDFLRTSRAAGKGLVGIYGQPRGGTNFIAAALHYHPRLFAVNEHVFDYRIPLRSIWWKRSVFRVDGRQDKQIEQLTSIVYNKMQAFNPELWDPRCRFPEGSRFIFYLRNPIRVHVSREAYRQRYKPRRLEWADTQQNFRTVLAETREIMEAYEILKNRYPCLVLSHEYLCCRHAEVLPRLHQFLGVEPLAPSSPRNFLRRCGRCGREFTVARHEGQEWLVCPRHRQRVSGQGRFNPLRPIDRAGILDESWKTTPDIERMLSDFRKLLGGRIADYFWNGNYDENLVPERGLVSRAA
jgi:hypothetical protein